MKPSNPGRKVRNEWIKITVLMRILSIWGRVLCRTLEHMLGKGKTGQWYLQIAALQQHIHLALLVFLLENLSWITWTWNYVRSSGMFPSHRMQPPASGASYLMLFGLPHTALSPPPTSSSRQCRLLRPSPHRSVEGTLSHLRWMHFHWNIWGNNWTFVGLTSVSNLLP